MREGPRTMSILTKERWPGGQARVKELPIPKPVCLSNLKRRPNKAHPPMPGAFKRSPPKRPGATS